MTVDGLFQLPPWSVDQKTKDVALLELLNRITASHRRRCPEYRKLLAVTNRPGGDARRLEDVPWIPVGLFKSHRLVSVPGEAIAVTLTSSGTTGQMPSRIYLDRATARLQTQALAHSIAGILGPERLPMMIADTRAVLSKRSEFSARGAGILGMMNHGRRHLFALDEDLRMDIAAVREFLRRHGGEPFLVFGFTFILWRHFFLEAELAGLDLSNGVLIHSGGWKKMADSAVTNEEFRRRLAAGVGLRRVFNFYGMVEQVGGVFLEGEDGHLYTTNFTDVIVRDPVTWQPTPPGAPGVIQVLSALPESYPGHSILTGDLGVLHGVDDSTCGRRGKHFSVLGRVPRAEPRGCSDTFQERAA
jgi:Acyl-protein synthetase, LuxE